ncbi:MAG: aminoacyl-tRNA hydrolase [bacterium]|nr:aminoacyl-tRNA hydrolase [bacterium]
MPTAIVVGLGNPGDRYARTWHNAGYWILERFAERQNWQFRAGKGEYYYSRGLFSDDTVVLVKPTTFMNASGFAVVDAIRFFDSDPKDLFVIFDDHDLPFGALRLRGKGSDGGHKGMRSIIELLGSMDFPRLRFGIRPPDGRSGNLAGKVLSEVPKKQQEEILLQIDRATDAVECYLKEGLLATMNKYNRTPAPEL